MRISDWSSDVCSSDLVGEAADQQVHLLGAAVPAPEAQALAPVLCGFGFTHAALGYRAVAPFCQALPGRNFPLRPEILFPLFAPATSLSGFGPRFAKLFETLTGGPAVLDLCRHLPSGLIDRRYEIGRAHV